MISKHHKIQKMTINALGKILLLFTTIFLIGGFVTESYGETTQEWKDECNRITYESDEDTSSHL